VIQGELVEDKTGLVVRDIFLRRYTADTRPFIPFHCDHAMVTVNICLTEHGETDGDGALIGLHDKKIVEFKRVEGDGTAHTSTLLHGVARIEEGTRYTCIIFFANSAKDS